MGFAAATVPEGQKKGAGSRAPWEPHVHPASQCSNWRMMPHASEHERKAESVPTLLDCSFKPEFDKNDTRCQQFSFTSTPATNS